jgi:hypothetical protein
VEIANVNKKTPSFLAIILSAVGIFILFQQSLSARFITTLDLIKVL